MDQRRDRFREVNDDMAELLVVVDDLPEVEMLLQQGKPHLRGVAVKLREFQVRLV